MGKARSGPSLGCCSRDPEVCVHWQGKPLGNWLGLGVGTAGPGFPAAPSACGALRSAWCSGRIQGSSAKGFLCEGPSLPSSPLASWPPASHRSCSAKAPSQGLHAPAGIGKSIRHCSHLHLKMPKHLISSLMYAVDLVFDLSYLIKCLLKRWFWLF